ncbi:FAD-binding oxidoreductase [Cupriavidus basilensis]
MPDAKAQKALWDVRKAGLNIMMSMKGDGKPVSFIEDCAVPLEHLAEYTRRLTAVFHKHETEGTWYAHAGVSTLHVRPILDMRRDGALRMREIAEEAAALVREVQGRLFRRSTATGCAGVSGVAWQYGPRINAAFGEIKALFDPDNASTRTRSCGRRSTDARGELPFRAGLRFRAAARAEALDWSAWNVTRNPLRPARKRRRAQAATARSGLAAAVEMCNNNGHCRKF